MLSFKVIKSERANEQDYSAPIEAMLPLDVKRFENINKLADEIISVTETIANYFEEGSPSWEHFSNHKHMVARMQRFKLDQQLVTYLGVLAEDLLRHAGELPKSLPKELQNRFFNMIDECLAVTSELIETKIHITILADDEDLIELSQNAINLISEGLEDAQRQFAEKYRWQRGKKNTSSNIGYITRTENGAKFFVEDSKNPLDFVSLNEEQESADSLNLDNYKFDK